MKRISFLTLPLLAALALSFSGCKPTAEQAAADDQVIKIGEYASLTGSEAAFGQSSHKGTLMAVEEINTDGGVLGKQLKLIYEDDLSKKGESAEIAKKLVSGDKVVAVLGEVASSRSLEAGPICQQAGIPMISPSSTNPKVTEVGDYIFRVCFTDDFQGKLIAQFALDTLKAKRVAIMKDVSQAYSIGLRDYFATAYTAGGGTIVTEKNYSSSDKDFNAQLTAIKADNPDAIFVPGYYMAAGLIIAQARQLGITVPIFGGDGWEAPELIQLAGDAAKDTYFSTHYSAENQSPMVQDFVKKFRTRFDGETPDAMAALGYDSVKVLVDAMKRAGTTDGPKLRDAIAATKDFIGVTGNTTLDEKRNARKPAVIITVQDGHFKYVETINP
jgi:branched-chain amino acid transport system substrate-binding protein